MAKTRAPRVCRDCGGEVLPRHLYCAECAAQRVKEHNIRHYRLSAKEQELLNGAVPFAERIACERYMRRGDRRNPRCLYVEVCIARGYCIARSQERIGAINARAAEAKREAKRTFGGIGAAVRNARDKRRKEREHGE